jgi:cell division protein FtsI (penicillin-binding protein 3)
MSYDGARPSLPFDAPTARPAFAYGINAPQAFSNARAQAAAAPFLEQSRKRLLVVALGFITCFLLIAGRLFDVMIFSAGDGASSAPPPPPPAISRADITDRHGELLATSLQMASLMADPGYILNEKETLTKLKGVFPDLNTQSLSKDLHSGKRFVWVKHNLTPKQEEAVLKLGLPGIDFRNEERRIYPKANLTAHLVGFNNIDQKGLAGIEHSLNKRLTENNAALPLSIDIRLQGIMRDAIAESMRSFNAVGGAGIMMDVQTGEILSLVSLPDFDPNLPGQVSESARFNRATLGTYEMGSTFKIFTLAQGLERNIINMTDSFNCINPLKYGRFLIRDYHPERRWLTLPEVFIHSSNIGAAQIAQRLSVAEQKSFTGSLGLLTPSPIEMTEVGKPLIPADWRELNKITISYGHGLSVSAVQLASAVASVVNGGKLVKPTLLKKDPAEVEEGKRVLSPATSAAMRSMMRAVVTEGTGKSADVKGYLVGGKTGTADKSAGGGYNRNSRLASFIAAFPMNNPRYLVFVMVDEPKGNKESHGFATGGWVAAPVINKVIAQSAALLRVPPTEIAEPDSLRLPVRVSQAPAAPKTPPSKAKKAN